MEFLNTSILGTNAGTFGERTFAFIGTEKIATTPYDPDFFEAFPTMWANAYAFQKSIEPADARNRKAVEEWVSLFLLHHFQILHLKSYDSDTLQKGYDEDLWPAIDRTYPRREKLLGISLLKTSEGIVVGAYYPTVVFFPSRGRSDWNKSPTLKLYLDRTKLSWKKCKEILLTEPDAIVRFCSRLRGIATRVLEGELQNALTEFCDEEPIFEIASTASPEGLDLNPYDWPPYDEPTPEKLLDRYPLKKTHEGGRTFYLVNGMSPLSDWMRWAIAPGMPSPVQYTQVGENQIEVLAFGRAILCNLNAGDRIVSLKDLFLSDHTYICGIPRQAATNTSMIRNFHKLEVRDDNGIFSTLKGQTAVCLAPVKREFLEHFPEILNEPDKFVEARRNSAADQIDWTFTILKKNIKWPAKLVHATALPYSSLALWPPKVAENWHFYVARGTGEKRKGRWMLVDENGKQGVNIELEDDEYISILKDSIVPNRPKALVVKDDAEKEKGILFLSKLEDRSVFESQKASLSVDFGTSNTCIAYKVDEKQPKPEPLVIELTPIMLWGESPRPELVTPGFIPFQWGGQKGFYPTILLTRGKDTSLKRLTPNEIEVEHLFHAAIPGLHKGLEAQILRRAGTPWVVHDNLKWELNSRKPYRELFLWLSLLYAHAELFFKYDAKIENYVFTFPLALPEEHRFFFHEEARRAIERTRRYCYGGGVKRDSINYIDNIDESTAIAISARTPGNPESMEVFIDLGGGTADIAIKHHNRFLVLDSIKVAGKAFFQIAKNNFSRSLYGATEFKKHLGELLEDANQEFSLKDMTVDFSTFYQLDINRRDDDYFKKKEQVILGAGMGRPSYQQYRTLLLFRHIIAYALLQAGAAVIEQRLSLPQGIKMILGGNAWGFLLFADLPRSRERLKQESKEILSVLKEHLSTHLSEEEKSLFESLGIFDIQLLNEQDLSAAKTAVAMGALMYTETDISASKPMDGSKKPYTGITIRNLRINDLNPIELRWCDRWDFEELKVKLSGQVGTDQITSVAFDYPKEIQGPIDPVLSIFTRLSNIGRFDKDKMNSEDWHEINSRLYQGKAYLESNKPKYAPVSYFLSRLLYPDDDTHHYLDLLAERNDTLGPGK